MKSDSPLKWIFLALVVAGFFILASASIGITSQRDLPPYYFVSRQLLYGALPGFLALLIMVRWPYRRLKKLALPIFILGLALTALVLTPKFGLEFGGARRWISLGPVSFQPSEFLKFGYILYLAALFSSSPGRASSVKRGLAPFILLTGAAGALLILEPDVGSLGVLVLAGLLLFIASGARARHVAVLILLSVILLAVLIRLEPYRFERIKVFFDPTYDPQDSGYQIKQALIAIGSGGVWGRGFGLSRQKFQYLPEPVSDSVFAVFAEEFGFIGSVFLVFLFVAFLWRGFRVAARSPDLFGRLLAAGIVILIVVASVVNIAALTGLLPLTGIPLLFISQGGSALTMTLAQVGILLNISKRHS